MINLIFFGTFLILPFYQKEFFGLSVLFLWQLMTMVFFLAKVVKEKSFYTLKKYFFETLRQEKTVAFFLGLIFFSSCLKNGFSGFSFFLTWFFLPIILSLFFSFYRQKASKENTVHFLFGYAAVLGAVAILQYVGFLPLPLLFRGNDVEVKRAVSFFTHPNFYALFISPILAFLTPFALERFSKFYQNDREKLKAEILFFAWILGVSGVILSMSRAAFLGLCFSAAFYLIYKRSKKILALAAVCLGILLGIFSFSPSLQNRYANIFIDKSTTSRFELWSFGKKAILENPVWGLGLGGFSKNFERYKSPNFLEHHNFPHNIFLNFWVEMGVFGVYLLIFSSIKIFWKLITKLKSSTADTDKNFYVGTFLLLLCMLAQGQVDNPYLKNDLAMLFWLFLSLI